MSLLSLFMSKKDKSKLSQEDISHLAKIFDWLLKADFEQDPHLYKKSPMHEKGSDDSIEISK